MPSKRPRDDAEDGTSLDAKKPKKGFSVGPQNLPDGPWRRKVDKVKKNLIVQAKVKKQYAKVKAQHEREDAARRAAAPAAPPTADTETPEEQQPDAKDAEEQIHPERQAMLDGDAPAPPTVKEANPKQQQQQRSRQRPDRARNQRDPRRPGYFDKSLEEAARKKAEVEAREQAVAARHAERDRRIAERERYRKAMAKAKAPGADGKRRLGRESHLLLDKVKRIMGEK